MGVEGFQTFIRREFRRHHYRSWIKLSGLLGRHVRRLYIDFNALIHTAVQRIMKPMDETERKSMQRNFSVDYWENIYDEICNNNKIIYHIDIIYK